MSFIESQLCKSGHAVFIPSFSGELVDRLPEVVVIGDDDAGPRGP